MAHFLSDLLGTLKETFRIGRATLDASALTANRTLTIRDQAGTVALLSDVGGSGISGDTPVFVQNVAPTPPGGAYTWIQTGLGPTGKGITIWVEDGM